MLPAAQACSRGFLLTERALLTWHGLWLAEVICEAQ